MFASPLQATPAEVPILPGAPTRVWTYQGQVLNGDPAALQPLEGTYLGPIIRVRRGQRVLIRFTHELPEKSIVHWHGLHVPEVMDGHPRYVIPRSETYVYDFEVITRAGTYWYHPHPHQRTGPQVYRGLAGFFLVSDEEEAAVGLPSGEYDIPLVIQDRTFDARNQLIYQPNGMMGGMMGGMTGFLGDRILVNGRPNYTLSVATRAYRLRLLNGSNSRIYKLAWEDGTPLTVIGTDGGLLEVPVQRSYVTLAPGERADLWVDFSGRPVGTEIALRSLPFAAGGMGHGGMGGGMRGGWRGGRPRRSLPNGAAFPVLKVRVDLEEGGSFTLPERLSTFERYQIGEAVNANAPRSFHLSMRHMVWTINGRLFEMEGVARDEIVQLNTLEAWDFADMSMMPHPMHAHGPQFQVLGRQVAWGGSSAWETVRAGYVDEGWKDTVLVMPGERVRVLLKFTEYLGLFLYH
ncbi:MAG: multicopper oxidase family protein, partial [Anaerolineales bacterium]